MKIAQVTKVVLNGGREKKKAGKSGKGESEDRKKQRKERRKRGMGSGGRERKERTLTNSLKCTFLVKDRLSKTYCF